MRLINDAVGFKHLYAGLNTERGFYGAALIELYQNPIKILQRLMQKGFTALVGCRMFLNPAAFPGNDEIQGIRNGLGAILGHPQNTKCSSMVCSVCPAQI